MNPTPRLFSSRRFSLLHALALPAALAVLVALSLLMDHTALPQPPVTSTSAEGQPMTGAMPRSLRLPRADVVADLLQTSGVLPVGASSAETHAAVQGWYQSQSDVLALGPDPQAFARLLVSEQALLSGDATHPAPLPPLHILAAVVEFAGTDTLARLAPHSDGGSSSGCVSTMTTFGPLFLGQDPPPSARDNFAFYKSGIGPGDYEAAIFGVGAESPGYGVVRPDLGGIDLSGLTLNNYLLEMSRGTYRTDGVVVAQTLRLSHAHEYYGAAVYAEDAQGRCVAAPGSDARFAEFVTDTAVTLAAAAALPAQIQDWQRLDADGDHVIDLLFIIHAGYGWQDRGNPDRLSASSSSFSAAGMALPQVVGQNTPAEEDDYYLDKFVVFPEQLDLGAIQEEFLHHLGLPDLYAFDGDTSNAFWGALAAGGWGGPVGGARPVGTNLWQDWLLGWRSPRVIDYDDPTLEVTLGRARQTPSGVEDGLVIRLPAKEFVVANRAGAGKGWWSGAGSDQDQRVTRLFDLSETGEALMFSFDAVWATDSGNYGYLEASTDAGAAWQTLPDLAGRLTQENPTGHNLGWGLTGSGQGRLRFDLSAFRGMSLWLRLRYVTTASSPALRRENGWWVDNFSLDDANGNLYSSELEYGFADWQNAGWSATPLVERIEHYYLAEWRDDTGFDRSLHDPYQIVYLDEANGETKINRLSATTPGLLISYRDLGEPFDYELMDSLAEPPSYGPKYGLLVVEAHSDPLRFDTTSPNYQGGWVGAPLSGRVLPGDALFGLTPTREWTARLGLNFDTGAWEPTPLETKTWPSRPAVSAFHDALGAVPGFFYPGAGSLIYLHDWDASAVIPARGAYTTAVTWPNGDPNPALYGVEVVSGRKLGTGHPGNDNVQYGLHLEVLQAANEQGRVRVWQALAELEGRAEASPATAATGDRVWLSFATRNVGRAGQYFAFVPLPAGGVYVPGSVSGDFFPVGEAQAQALLHGEAVAQAGADIIGFAYLGSLATGQTIAGSFAVAAAPLPGQTMIETRLLFYEDAVLFRSFRVAVALQNTPPTLTITGPDVGMEGGEWVAGGSFSDPDPDTWTLTVDYGDGAGPQALTYTADHRFDLSHVYTHEGSYLVTVSLTDGAVTANAGHPVQVLNVAPVLNLTTPDPVDEGAETHLRGAFRDPGADAWAVQVDWGDGGGWQPITLLPGQGDEHGFLLTHRYADSGSYQIQVAIDDGADLTRAEVTAVVRNVAPAVTLADTVTLMTTTPLALAGFFADPGSDAWSATVDYGAGDGPQPLVFSSDQRFLLAHQYILGGLYTITVTIADDDGGVGVAEVAATVYAVVKLPLVADTSVSSGAPGENYNARAGIFARTTGVDNALLVFDRRLLPPGSQILAADLSFEVVLESGAWGKQMALLNVDAFDPATVVYADRLRTFNPSPSQPVRLGDFVFDARAQVAAWDGLPSQSERGYLALAASGPAGRVAIPSLESWPPQSQAQLDVVFLP